MYTSVEGNLTFTTNDTQFLPVLSEASNYAVGFYLVFTGTMGVVGNALFMITLAKHRRFLTIHELFLLNLAVSDTGVCLTGYPWAASASFAQRWIFGHAGCQWYGFCGFFFGVASITTLGLISLDRFSTISCRNPAYQIRTRRRASLSITAVWMFSLFWALMPIVGWSEYVLEPYGTSCTVNWHGRRLEDISLILCLFICVIGVNIMAIAISYGGIVRTLRSRKRILPAHNAITAGTRRAEQKTTIVSFFVVTGFLVCWLPYAVFSLWYSYFSTSNVSVEATVVPALLAKSSSYINPLIYVVAVKRYRVMLLTSICHSPTSAVNAQKTPIGPSPMPVTPCPATPNGRFLTSPEDLRSRPVLITSSIGDAASTLHPVPPEQPESRTKQLGESTLNELRTQQRLKVTSSDLPKYRTTKEGDRVLSVIESSG